MSSVHFRKVYDFTRLQGGEAHLDLGCAARQPAVEFGERAAQATSPDPGPRKLLRRSHHWLQCREDSASG